MRSHASSYLMRAVCAVSVSSLLVIGPIGCGGGDAADTKIGGTGELPPEAKKANENMENFMKNQQKK